MDDYLLAVPSESDQGLDSRVAGHFGHSPFFTLVRMRRGEVAGVRAVENPPHRAGGCLAPVAALNRGGVDALVVGGMGRRPLEAMRNAGISVFRLPEGAAGTVAEAVRLFTAGDLPVMAPETACSGHGCH